MNDITIWLVFTIIVVAFIAWILWECQREKVVCDSRIITKKYKGKHESIKISDLAEIKYHYHAAVGFLSTWEFIDRNGSLLRIDGKSEGITEVLSDLERILPNFTLGNFKEQFDTGDVEDIIDVWKNA